MNSSEFGKTCMKYVQKAFLLGTLMCAPSFLVCTRLTTYVWEHAHSLDFRGNNTPLLDVLQNSWVIAQPDGCTSISLTCSRAQSSWINQSGWSLGGSGIGRTGTMADDFSAFVWPCFSSRDSLSQRMRASGRSNNERGTSCCSSRWTFTRRAE